MYYSLCLMKYDVLVRFFWTEFTPANYFKIPRRSVFVQLQSMGLGGQMFWELGSCICVPQVRFYALCNSVFLLHVTFFIHFTRSVLIDSLCYRIQCLLIVL